MSPSLDFGVPLTGIDSVIPGWDAFNPPHWNEFCPSVMNPQQRRPQAQRCKMLTMTSNEISVRVGNSYMEPENRQIY